MKKLFLLICFVLSSSLMAQTSFQICESQGEKFGKLNEIDSQCRTLAKSAVSKQNHIKGTVVEVFGHKNILFIDYKINGEVKKFKIAGDMTLINKIRAVKLSHDEKKVYVLDSNRILAFNTMTSGNSAPSLVIETSGSNCSQLKILDDLSSYYMLCGQQLVSGSLDGDSRYKKNSRKPSSSSNYKLNDLGLNTDIIIDIYKGNLVVVDRISKKLNSFNLSEKLTPEWSIDLADETSYEIISLKTSTDKITIVDAHGTKLEFN